MAKQKDHMAKAINELSTHRAPNHVWEGILAELDLEQGIAHLDQALEGFKSAHKAPESVWSKLEFELDKLELEKPLREAIESLPQHSAPVLFDEIDSLEAKQVSLDHRLKWVSGIAASLLLLIGVYFFYTSEETVLIANYTEESAASNEIVKAAIDQLAEDDEILEVIEVHCAQIALRCESDEFKGLFDYYLELDASKEELLQVMNDNQEQIQLVDYLVRVEKEKDEVGKQLIQMIIG